MILRAPCRERESERERESKFPGPVPKRGFYTHQASDRLYSYPYRYRRDGVRQAYDLTKCRHYRTSDRRGAMTCVPFFIYGCSSSTVTVAAQSILCHLDRVLCQLDRCKAYCRRTEDKSAWPTCNLWNLVFPKMSSFS
ncbi:hypothetical protein BHM03_00059277 [Ensete ventricosum]|nr:hypothetical protein BHM03_00059277 [Ensete ventricosum]